jgi:peroxiredoxin
MAELGKGSRAPGFSFLDQDGKTVALAAVGIGPEAPAAQEKSAGKYSLGFPLLSDPDHIESWYTVSPADTVHFARKALEDQGKGGQQ